jgi:hypothetical protein
MHYHMATCFGNIRPSSGNTFIRNVMHCVLIKYHSFSYVVHVLFIFSLKCGYFCISLVCCFLDCAYQASLCVFCTGDCFPGAKRQKGEAGHSHPSSAEVKNDGATPPLPHTFSGFRA